MNRPGHKLNSENIPFIRSQLHNRALRVHAKIWKPAVLDSTATLESALFLKLSVVEALNNLNLLRVNQNSLRRLLSLQNFLTLGQFIRPIQWFRLYWLWKRR